MTLNPLYGFDELPKTSAAAIREFNDRYLAAIGAARPTGWADTLGDLIPTDRPMDTFPINQLRTFYQRSTGENRSKKLRETSFDVKTEEFDDGYEARLADLFLKVFAYRQWQAAPARLVTAEEQHRHNSIALILDGSGTRGGSVGSANDPGGVSRLCVDGANFFSTSHPVNMVDATVTRKTDNSATWSNYQSSAKNVLGSQASGNTGAFLLDNLQAEVTAGENQVTDENGQLLGVKYDTIVVPTDYEEPLVNGLSNARLLTYVGQPGSGASSAAGAAIENPYRGRFQIVGAKEFTQTSSSTADWYLVDSKLIREAPPWLALRQTMPANLAMRIYDESTDYFRDTGNLKISSHIWYGFSLVLPHAIRRIKGPTR